MTNNKEIEEIYFFVGKKIRERRKQLKLCQKVLGKKIKTDSRQIYKYENGVIRIPVFMLFKISKALKKPISYFFPQHIVFLDEEEDEEEDEEKNDFFPQHVVFLDVEENDY
jgi:transcriptional regulator with XRE-family HTH domain